MQRGTENASGSVRGQDASATRRTETVRPTRPPPRPPRPPALCFRVLIDCREGEAEGEGEGEGGREPPQAEALTGAITADGGDLCAALLTCDH
jgi:hypothetical protein